MEKLIPMTYAKLPIEQREIIDISVRIDFNIKLLMQRIGTFRTLSSLSELNNLIEDLHDNMDIIMSREYAENTENKDLDDNMGHN